MNIRKKIELLPFCILAWSFTIAQTDAVLLPAAHKFFINPSFTGLNKNSEMWTGTLFRETPEKKTDYSYLMSFGTYSEKLHGGIGCYFIQEVEGMTNTNNSGVGFTYAGTVLSKTAGQLIVSGNINYLIATKQWYTYTIDGLLDKQTEAPAPPGEEFHRYNTIIPRTGILWNSDFFQGGLTVMLPVQKNTIVLNRTVDVLSPGFIFHLSKNNRKNKNGLISQPYQINQEITVLSAENTLFTRAGLRVEYTDYSYFLFMQSDFYKNIYGIAGMIGKNLNNLRFTISAGFSYSATGKKVLLNGEAGIGFIIPGIYSDENKPWSSSRNFY